MTYFFTSKFLVYFFYNAFVKLEFNIRCIKTSLTFGLYVCVNTINDG